MRAFLVALAFLACLSPCAWADEPTLRGEVLESQDAGSYTYLRLRESSKGDIWVAVPRVPVSRGATVSVFSPAEMRDFESPTLGRTFESVYFGVLGVESRDPHAAAGAAEQPVAEPVAKADGPGARTVAEVISERKDLDGGTVLVRARVDRVSANVMGLNWVHLRDGSGTPAEGNYDLVATSEELPKVGDIVVARGTVRTDFDAGMGHAFKVLVEKASFR